jgi:hypothetical protein
LNCIIFNINFSLKQNNLKLKNEEVKQMEKLVEANQQKTSTLSSQLDEVNMMNSQLALQNTDAKRRIMSIDLVNKKYYL